MKKHMVRRSWCEYKLHWFRQFYANPTCPAEGTKAGRFCYLLSLYKENEIWILFDSEEVGFPAKKGSIEVPSAEEIYIIGAAICPDFLTLRAFAKGWSQSYRGTNPTKKRTKYRWGKLAEKEKAGGYRVIPIPKFQEYHQLMYRIDRGYIRTSEL